MFTSCAPVAWAVSPWASAGVGWWRWGWRGVGTSERVKWRLVVRKEETPKSGNKTSKYVLSCEGTQMCVVGYGKYTALLLAWVIFLCFSSPRAVCVCVWCWLLFFHDSHVYVCVLRSCDRLTNNHCGILFSDPPQLIWSWQWQGHPMCPTRGKCLLWAISFSQQMYKKDLSPLLNDTSYSLWLHSNYYTQFF